VLAQHQAGDRVTVTFVRGPGDTQTVAVTLGELPGSPQ